MSYPAWAEGLVNMISRLLFINIWQQLLKNVTLDLITEFDQVRTLEQAQKSLESVSVSQTVFSTAASPQDHPQDPNKNIISTAASKTSKCFFYRNNRCLHSDCPAWNATNRVFANGPGDQGSIPGHVITKTQKMVLDASLFNTQNYKVGIKVKWSNPGNGVAPSLHLGVVAIEKGAFGSLSTKVANFTYMFKNGFSINNLQWLMSHKTKPHQVWYLKKTKYTALKQMASYTNSAAYRLE